MDTRDHAPVLVEFQRGGADRIETRHRGSVAVVHPSGRLLWAVGDVEGAYALRSTAKPFQLLPLLLDGLHGASDEHAALEAADLAVMMSSHNGEPMHTERIAALLARFHLAPDALQCGVERPALRQDRERLLLANQPATSLHCNCSGKHTSMLAVCSRRGWPLESYLDAEHPLQRRIRDMITVLAGNENPTLPHSIDGCSLPTWWISLRALARLFAYIADPSAAPPVEGRSIETELTTLRGAGMRHPEQIAGSGRLDTVLMRALEGRLFAKTGADGLYAVALPAAARAATPLGIAIKVEDGDPGSRIRALVIGEVLRQLGVIGGDDRDLHETLETIAAPAQRNFRGLEVGRYQPVFRLLQP